MIATPSSAPLQLPAMHPKFPNLTMLTLEDVASVFDISVRTLHRWISGGDIPDTVKVGGRTYWHYFVIEDWIKAGCPAQNNSSQAHSRSSSNGINL